MHVTQAILDATTCVKATEAAGLHFSLMNTAPKVHSFGAPGTVRTLTFKSQSYHLLSCSPLPHV